MMENKVTIYKCDVMHDLKALFDNAGDYFKDEYELVKQYIEQLEQALDKACKQLTHAYPFGVNKCETDAWDDSWKEWAFKNDER